VAVSLGAVPGVAGQLIRALRRHERSLRTISAPLHEASSASLMEPHGENS
jgi:hypothetical protein